MSGFSLATSARLAAWCTVALVVLGPVSLVVIPSMTTAPGDLAATASLLEARAPLARLGLLGELGIVAVELIMTVALYGLFREVHRDGAHFVAGTRLGMTLLQAVTAVAGFAAVAWFAAGHGDLGGGAGLLDLRVAGTQTWQFVFGLHCVGLGWMITRSRLVPRWLGIAMGGAGLAYLAMGGLPLLAPGPRPTIDAVIGVLATVGEVPFYVHLLLRPLRPVG